jgi:hypothetical protein
MGVAAGGKVVQVGDEIGGECDLSRSRAAAVRGHWHAVSVGGLAGGTGRGNGGGDDG